MFIASDFVMSGYNLSKDSCTSITSMCERIIISVYVGLSGIEENRYLANECFLVGS